MCVTTKLGDTLSDSMDIPYGVPKGQCAVPDFLQYLYFWLSAKYKVQVDSLCWWHCNPNLQIRYNNITKRLSDTTNKFNDNFRRFKIKINSDKTRLIFFTERKIKQIPKGHLVFDNANIQWRGSHKPHEIRNKRSYCISNTSDPKCASTTVCLNNR